MSDYVAFEPSSLEQLSKSLDALAQNLAGSLPKVVSIISAANGHAAGSGNVRMWASKARDDANDMHFRSKRAWELVRQGKAYKPPNFSLVFSPGLVNIDWSATSKSGQQAQADAQALRQALSDKNRAASRKSILAIANNLRTHLGDKAYLAIFWSTAGPDAAKLARVLHDHHGDEKNIVLTAEDKKILAAFGDSLAAASREKVFSSDNWPIITRPGDDYRWSANMLLRYGPNGSKWDRWFLAQWARDTLDWRRNRMAHENVQPNVSLELYAKDSSSPIGQEYEPTLTLLQRLGENRGASRLLLGDKVNGLVYTRDLIDPSWFTRTNPVDPNSFEMDFSNYAGSVLRAAAYQKRGNGVDSELSTRAVANMVRVTNQYKSSDGYPALPGGLRHALTDVAIAYIPDFAASAGHKDQNPNKPDPGVTDAVRDQMKGSPWIVYTTKSQLEGFLGEALHDPADLGRYRAAVDAQFSPAMRVELQTDKSGSGHQYFIELANLRGLTQGVEAGLNYSKAQKKDADAAANQALFDIMLGGFGALPVDKVGPHQVVSGVFQAAMDRAFNTSHAAKVSDQNKQDARNLVLGMNVPVVQGLVDAGCIKKSDMPPLRDGKIVTGQPFDIWYSNHSAKRYGGKAISDWVLIAEHGVERQIGVSGS